MGRISICACLVVGMLLSSVAVADTLRIATLGDSITAGFLDRQTYRYPLWKKLIDAGVDFDFVGSMHTNYGGNPPFPQYVGRTFDNDHEGHSGWRSCYIVDGRPTLPTDGKLSDWLGQYEADVVLLHIGTCDLIEVAGDPYWQYRSPESIVYDIGRTIDTFRADNPDVTVLLAKLIPYRDHIDGVLGVNALIDGLASSKSTLQSPILVVDQYNGFNVDLDTTDGCHPNASGEEKMAQKWFDALVPIPEPATLSLLALGGLALIRRRRRRSSRA